MHFLLIQRWSQPGTYRLANPPCTLLHKFAKSCTLHLPCSARAAVPRCLVEVWEQRLLGRELISSESVVWKSEPESYQPPLLFTPCGDGAFPIQGRKVESKHGAYGRCLHIGTFP